MFVVLSVFLNIYLNIYLNIVFILFLKYSISCLLSILITSFKNNEIKIKICTQISIYLYQILLFFRINF